jgi:hypothetical protein
MMSEMTLLENKVAQQPVVNAAQREVEQRVANLEHWLETMRQKGGYGGPVSHWWQNRFRYAGPGLDWRYEGILIGYTNLFQKTRLPLFKTRLERAVRDLLIGQTPDGHFLASRFEINPGLLGTPHEAAASLGLLHACDSVEDKAAVLIGVKRNLDAIIRALWDGQGFNDRPKIPGRVPNKLATLAQTFLMYSEKSGDARYLSYAKAALEDVLRFTVSSGKFRGAIHQYAPDTKTGDGRFFPYYNARCIPPLVKAYEVLGETRYLESAKHTLNFVTSTMLDDGSWPQIIYSNGSKASWPRWFAGVADILLAYETLNETVPQLALERLLASQLASGSFPTAFGFNSQVSQRTASTMDYRDVLPVAGWNDKVFRLLSKQVSAVPSATTLRADVPITIGKQHATFIEDNDCITLQNARSVFYLWYKNEVWARRVHKTLDVY